MSFLECHDLTRIFGNGETAVTALDHLNLNIEEGAFVALVGASGSGKSTLLHLLGGLDSPNSGDIIIDGVAIAHLSEKELAVFRRRKVGLVYQFFNLIPTLTVEQNMILPRLLDGRPPEAAQIRQLAEHLGLADKLHSLPAQLSGGQQQRVAIGRALSNQPAILLADEPTGNLDRENSRIIMDLLREANRRLGQTIILVTHDEQLALGADRLIRLEDGRIVRDEVMRR